VRQNVAHLGGEVSEGGGICLQQSRLVVVDSSCLGNIASEGGTVSRGGLISMIAPSTADLSGSALEKNRALLGGLQNFGGAVYAGQGATRIQLASSSVRQNVASGIGLAAGGAFYLAAQVGLLIDDSELIRNQADGDQAEGGAIWSAAGSLHATNTTFQSNSAVAHGLDESALGGALFQLGPSATLEACSLTDNLARIAGLALRASGGAVHCATGALTTLVGCILHGNAAGGKGNLRSHPTWYASAIAEQLESAGMHIYSSGSVVMDRCRMVERTLTDVEYAMWYWIVSEGGRMTLGASVFETSASHYYDPCPFARDGTCDAGQMCPPGSDWEDCGLTPPPDAGPFGKLVNVRSREAEFVVRGSTVTNLTLKSVPLVGAVNSSFEPPLIPSQAVQPQPGCGVVLAGERLCDPRARCVQAQLGGVECACMANGLQDADGSLRNGRRCMQDAQIRMQVQAESFTMRVQKPSILGRGRRVQTVLQAEGEHALRVGYSMRATCTSALGGAILTGVSNASKTWEQLHSTTYSFNGLRMAWDRPPSADTELDLDANATRFAATKTFVVVFTADCDGARPCTQDGDTFETVLTVAAQSDPTELRSTVIITTVVESLLSCKHSTAYVELDVVPRSTPIHLIVSAIDVDNLPISFTRAEIFCVFGDRSIPLQWSRGSSEYIAAVPAELTAQPGVYDLVVTIHNAWNETGPATSCELLRRRITVEEGLSTSWILAGAAGAAVVVIGGTTVVVRKRHAHLQAIMMLLFTEASPPLARPPLEWSLGHVLKHI
jgi:hypothetical protein